MQSSYKVGDVQINTERAEVALVLDTTGQRAWRSQWGMTSRCTETGPTRMTPEDIGVLPLEEFGAGLGGLAALPEGGESRIA